MLMVIKAGIIYFIKELQFFIIIMIGVTIIIVNLSVTMEMVVS